MRRRRRVKTICERQHRSLRMWAFSLVTLAALVLSNTCETHADTITQVEQTLEAGSVLPMAQGVALDLAQNLMTAQADSSYAASEPDSLPLSEDAVLRAIMLEDTLFGVTLVTADPTSLAWLQSQIAIDDRAGVGITINGVPCNPDGGCSIDFGKVAVPELSEWTMLLTGLDVLLVGAWFRRRRQ